MLSRSALDYFAVMPLGELLDLISCWKIYKGAAKEKIIYSDPDGDDLFPDLI